MQIPLLITSAPSTRSRHPARSCIPFLHVLRQSRWDKGSWYISMTPWRSCPKTYRVISSLPIMSGLCRCSRSALSIQSIYMIVPPKIKPKIMLILNKNKRVMMQCWTIIKSLVRRLTPPLESPNSAWISRSTANRIWAWAQMSNSWFTFSRRNREIA